MFTFNAPAALRTRERQHGSGTQRAGDQTLATTVPNFLRCTMAFERICAVVHIPMAITLPLYKYQPIHTPDVTYACTRSANTASTVMMHGCRTRLGIITWLHCNVPQVKPILCSDTGWPIYANPHARTHSYKTHDTHLPLNPAHVVQIDKFQRLVSIVVCIMTMAVAACGPAFDATMDDGVRASGDSVDDLVVHTTHSRHQQTTTWTRCGTRTISSYLIILR